MGSAVSLLNVDRTLFRIFFHHFLLHIKRAKGRLERTPAFSHPALLISPFVGGSRVTTATKISLQTSLAHCHHSGICFTTRDKGRL